MIVLFGVFMLKTQKRVFGWGFAPDPVEKLTMQPKPPGGRDGPLCEGNGH